MNSSVRNIVKPPHKLVFCFLAFCTSPVFTLGTQDSQDSHRTHIVTSHTAAKCGGFGCASILSLQETLHKRLETSWSSNTCSKSLFRGVSCLKVFTLGAGEILENFSLLNEHDHGAKGNCFKPRDDTINCLHFTFLPLYMLFSSMNKCEHCLVQLCQQKL